MTTLSSIITGGKDSGISGTGKRAAYAMISRNTSSTWSGYCLYDEFFRPVVNWGAMYNFNNYGASNIVQVGDGTYSTSDMFSYNSSPTQTTPSSNSTSNYMNATNACGEFGNAMVDVYSDGTFGSQARTNGGWNQKHYMNRNAINSDHSNKRIAYLLNGGAIQAVDRLFGSYNSSLAGTSSYTVSSLNGSMSGSASYHSARKEFTILSYLSSSGQYNVITFQNVDLNTYPDPSVAFARPEVVRVNSTVTLPNWYVNGNETYYNLKPVVTDDGSVFVGVMHYGNSLNLYKFTRNGTTAVNASFLTSLSLTTSYGQDNGVSYGQRQITSRDGTSVALFCTYYYYGSGVDLFMIDKKFNTYTSYQNGDTNYGIMVVPYGDNGWATYYAGNVYASNWSGAYIASIYERNATGGFTGTGATVYLPQLTGPNTTNYPGFTQVTDYDLLIPNRYGAK